MNSRTTRMALGLRIGQFVQAPESGLGTGKVATILHDTATVEYFDSPVSEPFAVEVPVNALRPVILEEQTRVFWQDPTTGSWRVGRAIGPVYETYYRVQFPNKAVDDLPESALQVRWRKPIADPTTYLAFRLNETPIFHFGRTGFIACLMGQRRYSGGMPALLSSSISLEEHQVQVVQRVLQDPVARYLLADEVGLGKTIEAGVLIRQFLLDFDFQKRVIILVPDHLVAQWSEELTDKFHLGPWLEEKVIVAPHSTAESLASLCEAGCMLVVDEAHHIAALATSARPEANRRFQVVMKSANAATSLLLLSATPVLHNEQSFLAMLHLLDPATYSLDDIDSFRERVRLRQEVAELFLGMTEDQQDYFLSEQARELCHHFPHDQRLHELVSRMIGIIDGGPEEEDHRRLTAIRAVRAHISETYRLHRRILRNRRSDGVYDLLPGRAGLDVRCYEDPVEKEIHDLVDEWRVEAALAAEDLSPAIQAGVVELFRHFFVGLLSDHRLLQAMVQARLNGSSEKLAEFKYIYNGGNPFAEAFQFKKEKDILTRLEKVLAGKAPEERLRELELLLRELGREQVKAVVFASHETTAGRIYSYLAPRLPKQVTRFALACKHSVSEWNRFRTDSHCTVLVCGPEAEEGLNLQGKRVALIHYDFPLSPNRIEQRIGRLDRYGTGSEIQSFALLEGDCELIEGWYNHLDLGYRIFNRSVASLQYLIDEYLQRLWPDVLNNGMDAFEDATAALEDEKAGIERELRRIRSQDGMDSIEVLQPLDDHDAVTFDERFEQDEHYEEMRQKVEGWVVHCMRFKPLWADTDDQNGVRYQYKQGGTLMPFREYLNRFAHAIDGEQAEKGRLSTHALCYRRQQAVQQRRQMARIGTPFIDAMSYSVQNDDRGISFAFWRYLPTVSLSEPAQIYFRFDYVVEGDIKSAVKVLKEIGEESGQLSLRRLADNLFPPVMRAIWLDEELRVVTDESILAVLSEPYNKYPNSLHTGRDYNLNAERWQKIDSSYPAASWRELCFIARRQSEEQLRAQLDLLQLTRSCAERARNQATVRQEQMKSRLAQLNGIVARQEEQEVYKEMKLSAALEEGILNPSIRLDSLGAIFLSASDPFQD